MEAFVATVESGSFTAAGERIGLSQQRVAKRVADLEAHLQASLLERTTRRQRLTLVGERYYQRCRQILQEIDAAESLPRELEASLSGSLCIGAAKTFGIHSLMPFINDFMARHPSVDVELSLGEQRANLLEEGLDAAFRIGPVGDESLIARPLSPYRLVCCATPGYLQRFGVPRHPRDLIDHHCLDYRFSSPATPNIWVFVDRKGLSHPVSVSARLRIDESHALLQAALAGRGILMAPEVMVRRHLAEAALTPLLADYSGPTRPVHFIYRPDRYRTRLMRTLIEDVMRWFGSGQPAAGGRTEKGYPVRS